MLFFSRDQISIWEKDGSACPGQCSCLGIVVSATTRSPSISVGCSVVDGFCSLYLHFEDGLVLEISTSSDVWSVSETPHLKLQCGGNRAKDSGMHLKKMSCERTDVKETTEDPLVSEVT